MNVPLEFVRFDPGQCIVDDPHGIAGRVEQLHSGAGQRESPPQAGKQFRSHVVFDEPDGSRKSRWGNPEAFCGLSNVLRFAYGSKRRKPGPQSIDTNQSLHELSRLEQMTKMTDLVDK